ncbi:translation release factor activity protein [[Candida] boidinii]|nr:translation release factor activity protein [[Candida] boidinii]OWB74590.1 translation release factor activity protein [[Candida] boidinii]
MILPRYSIIRSCRYRQITLTLKFISQVRFKSKATTRNSTIQSQQSQQSQINEINEIDIDDPKLRSSVNQWIINFKDEDPINLKDKFEIEYARSSGPGGQHVNKTETKVIIKLSETNWLKSRGDWLNKTLFDNLIKNHSNNNNNNNNNKGKLKFPYLTPNGSILIMSELTRYKEQNLKDCLNKFKINFLKYSKLPEIKSNETIKKWENLNEKENNKRLNLKKIKSDKKLTRKKFNYSFD